MATLATSFSIRSYCTSNGSKESSKMVASTCCAIGKGETDGESKMDMQRMLVHGKQYGCSTKCSFRNRCFKTRAASSIPANKTEENSSKYLFRTQKGGLVNVSVAKKSMKYSVRIEVSSLELGVTDEDLVLTWGIYRSNSSSFMPLDLESSVSNPTTMMNEFPFTRNSFGTYGLEMEFETYLLPFYLSFLLKCPSGADSDSSEIKSHMQRNFNVPVGFHSGYPSPLGLSRSTDGRMNFAIFSRNVDSVNLCLYHDNASEKPALEIELDPHVNRTGDIWHASIDSVGPFVSYGYRCKESNLPERENKVLLDPQAKIIRKSDLGRPNLGELCDMPKFDWKGDVRPCLPLEKLIVYRLNIVHFTKDKSSNLPGDIAGTFTGVTKKLQHFKDLAVNALLLEPIFPFSNEKGAYFPFHFFSPVNIYGPWSDSISAIDSIKETVKTMHANGIEIYLEVVFTHTAEGTTLQDIDFPSFYHLDLGARNALNCNYPIVQQFIIDVLQYWVTEFRIDGFCFINASHLLRGFHGEYLSRPSLLEAIAFDPLLSKTKIIADCWDPNDISYKEIIFPHWKRWAEMNSKFCTDVRNFVRGEGLLSNLATRLCGSGDIFSTGRGPAFSFNFIARNFGLSLVDLVSFSDGISVSELSWNCGEEGPTSNKVVLERRLKQIRNFLFILFISLGVPVLNMGDECGQSSNGSSFYNDRKHLNWDALKTAFGVQTTQFISYLTSLRKRRGDLLQKQNFLNEEMIEWYGHDLSPPKWDDPTARFLAMTLKAENEEVKQNSNSSPLQGDLYVAFNAADHSETVILPFPPEEMSWVRLVDTALAFPGFFTSGGEPISEQMPGLTTYQMKSYSCVLFEAK